MKEPFPGFGRFYLLSDPCSPVRYRGRWVSESETLPALRGECSFAEPPLIHWAMGKSDPGKLIWTMSAFAMVVQRTFVHALEQAGMTGWSTYEVSVLDGARTPRPDYVGLAIAGRCGGVDYRRSEVVLREYPGGWFPELRGIFFPEESWDGADFFMSGAPDEQGRTAHVFCTERAARLLKKRKMTEVRCETLSDVLTSVTIFERKRLASERLPRDLVARVLEAYRETGHPLPERWKARAEEAERSAKSAGL